MIRHVRFWCRVICLISPLLLSCTHARRAYYNTSSSRDPNKLNVHIVHHSHNDPGWLHTYAQYHRTLILDGHTIGGVEGILDSVTSALLDNPDRTFAYADIAFFAKWWQELHADTKDLVRQLVQQRRLEFVNGGIVQHDEATSHYSAMIDQLFMGMRFLQQEFGVTPRIAWHLDGFGHSNTEAMLRSMGGFDALFFGRSDESDLQQRKQTGNLELVWRGSESLGSKTDIFVVQYPTGNYGPPSMKWWFEKRDNYGKHAPDWIRDDPETLDGYNVQATVDLFVKKARKWQSFVQGNDVLFLMGGDFSHSNAWQWFNSVDKMIHYVNKDGRVNAFYSTPAKYVQAKLSTPSLHWALKTDDFFPYCGDKNGTDYWTGFYTSRPTLKGQIRRASALLQVTRQVELAAGLGPSSPALATSRGFQDDPDVVGQQLDSEVVIRSNELAPDGDIAVLEFGLAVLHHHDGITGTQKYDIAHDYQHWLHVGMIKAAPRFLDGLHKLMYPTSHTTHASADKLHSSSTMQGSNPDHSAKTSLKLNSTHSISNPSSSAVTTSSAAGAALADNTTIASRVGWLFRRRLAQVAGALAAADYVDATDNEEELEDLQDDDDSEETAMPAQSARASNASASNASAGFEAQQQRFDHRADAALNSTDAAAPQLRMCLLLNASYCVSSMQLSKQEGFLLVVYNPLAWEYNQGVKIPVDKGSYLVHDCEGKPVPSQLLPVSESLQMIWNSTVLPAADTPRQAAAAAARGHEGLGEWELALQVRAPPLGHAVYTVKRVTAATHEQVAGSAPFQEADQKKKNVDAGIPRLGVTVASTVTKLAQQSPDITLSTGSLGVTVSAAAGGFTAARVAGREYRFNLELMVYSGRHQRSGAYTFKLDKQPDLLEPEVTVIQGSVLQEVRLYYERLGMLAVKLWKGASHLEVEWTVGVLPTKLNCEVFVRYDTDVKSGGVWYTDANGREYQQRRRSYRPAFKLPDASEFVPGNLYPVTTGAYIIEQQSQHAGTGRGNGSYQAQHLAAQVHIAVDRPQGVASLYDGGVDFNVHRVSMVDDGKGMVELLWDRTVARGTHIVSFGSGHPVDVSGSPTDSVIDDSSLYTTSRHHQQILVDPLQFAFGPLPASEALLVAKSSLINQTHFRNLPASIHILTLKWLTCDTLVLRLSHMFQIDEHPMLSATVEVDVYNLLNIDVDSIIESSLFGETAYQQHHHYDFQLGINLTIWDPPRNLKTPSEQQKDNRIVGEIPRRTMISLHPMQIRSFFVHIKHNKQRPICGDARFQHGTAAASRVLSNSISRVSYSHSGLTYNGHLRIFGAQLNVGFKLPEYFLVMSPFFVTISLWLLLCWNKYLRKRTKGWRYRSKRTSMSQSPEAPLGLLV